MRHFFKEILLSLKIKFLEFKLKRIKKLELKKNIIESMPSLNQPILGTNIVPNGTVININNDKSILNTDLISDKLNNEEKKRLRQTTKTFMWTLVVASLIWISWSYVLATISLILLQNPEPLSELSREVCTVILGSVIGYMCKSFIETFAQKTSEMLERHWHENNQNNYISTELNSQNNDFMEE